MPTAPPETSSSSSIAISDGSVIFRMIMSLQNPSADHSGLVCRAYDNALVAAVTQITRT
jgi:hypothetical protein